MKEELKKSVLEHLNKLSPSDAAKVRSLYKMTNSIKGETNEEFVENITKDKVGEGVIKMVNKQLGL
jgi:hypothetical protein